MGSVVHVRIGGYLVAPVAVPTVRIESNWAGPESEPVAIVEGGGPQVEEPNGARRSDAWRRCRHVKGDAVCHPISYTR